MFFCCVLLWYTISLCFFSVLSAVGCDIARLECIRLLPWFSKCSFGDKTGGAWNVAWVVDLMSVCVLVVKTMVVCAQLNSFSFCFTVTCDLCTLVFNIRTCSSPPWRLAVWMQEFDDCTHKVLFSEVSFVYMGYEVLVTALTCDQCVNTLSLALVQKACGSDMGRFPFGENVGL